MASRLVVAVVIVVVVLGASTGYYVSTLNSGPAGSVTVQVMVTAGLPSNGQPDEFIPRNFTVLECQHVTIVFFNPDDDPHELAIPAFGVDTGVVQSGVTTRVTFIPSQVGVFPYFEPAGVCGNCTEAQETSGNMTVLAS